MNNTMGTEWTLEVFQQIQTHELGHSLGLDDGDASSGPAGMFIDDNYVAGMAPSTLTNAFADKINPLDPESTLTSGVIKKFEVLDFDNSPNMVPNLLMESNGDGNLAMGTLDFDSYAGRQYLYPANPVPEPNAFVMLSFLLGMLGLRLRK